MTYQPSNPYFLFIARRVNMNDFYLNRQGSSKVMADLFMALTVILISTSVILPKKFPVADNEPPEGVVWQHIYKTNDSTCFNDQCFGSIAKALANANQDDYLLIDVSQTTSSKHLFELVQHTQQAGFNHIFLEQE